MLYWSQQESVHFVFMLKILRILVPLTRLVLIVCIECDSCLFNFILLYKDVLFTFDNTEAQIFQLRFWISTSTTVVRAVIYVIWTRGWQLLFALHLSVVSAAMLVVPSLYLFTILLVHQWLTRLLYFLLKVWVLIQVTSSTKISNFVYTLEMKVQRLDVIDVLRVQRRAKADAIISSELIWRAKYGLICKRLRALFVRN